jgi:hypothetical protein
MPAGAGIRGIGARHGRRARKRGDYPSADWADQRIECGYADGPLAGSWTGLAGMAEGFRGISTVWKDLSQRAEEYVELDRERVLVLPIWSGRGKTSGIELNEVLARDASLPRIRNGRVMRLFVYFDRDRALADLGLKE